MIEDAEGDCVDLLGIDADARKVEAVGVCDRERRSGAEYLECSCSIQEQVGDRSVSGNKLNTGVNTSTDS